MTLLAPDHTLAPGFISCLQRSLLLATTQDYPVPMDGRTVTPLQRLIDGKRKAIASLWQGPIDGDFNDFSVNRKDGEIHLSFQGSPQLRVPPNVAEPLNYRMGVPLWVLGRGRQDQFVVLACGLAHPLYNSAHLDVFSPVTGENLTRQYIFDPRAEAELGTQRNPEEISALMMARARLEIGRLKRMGVALEDGYFREAPAAPFPPSAIGQ